MLQKNFNVLQLKSSQFLLTNVFLIVERYIPPNSSVHDLVHWRERMIPERPPQNFWTLNSNHLGKNSNFLCRLGKNVTLRIRDAFLGRLSLQLQFQTSCRDGRVRKNRRRPLARLILFYTFHRTICKMYYNFKRYAYLRLLDFPNATFHNFSTE